MRKRIGSVLIALLVVDISLGGVFAQDANETFTLGETINELLGMLSWLWVVPAAIAGKLMTNEFVYGASLGFDRYLFTLWQVARTTSLFAIGLIFVVGILRNFLGFKEVSEFGKLVKNVLLASIFVSVSRFALAAVIDLSIIMTSAVGSLPQVVLGDTRDDNNYSEVFRCKQTVSVSDFKVDNSTGTTRSQDTIGVTLDKISPSAGNVSGPLVFMGCALLGVDGFSFQINNNKNVMTQLAAGGVRLMIIVALIVPMVVLMIVNLVRIFYIWLRAMFGPLVVVFWFFGDSIGNETIKDMVNPLNMIGLIFLPVVVVAAISLSLIFMVALYAGLADESEQGTDGVSEMFNVTVTEVGNGTVIGDMSGGSIHYIGDIINNGLTLAGGFVGQLILAVFVVVILRVLVKASFGVSKLTSKISDGVFSAVQQAASMVPIVPIPGIGGTSINSLSKGTDKAQNTMKSLYNTRQSAQADHLAEHLGIQDNSTLSNSEIAELENEALSAGRRDAVPVGLFKQLKKLQKDKKIPGSTVKKVMQKWLVNGGLKQLKASTYAPLLGAAGIKEYTSANISEIWSDDSSSRLVKWIDGVMTDESLTEASTEEQFINKDIIESGTTGIRQEYGSIAD